MLIGMVLGAGYVLCGALSVAILSMFGGAPWWFTLIAFLLGPISLPLLVVMMLLIGQIYGRR